MFLGKFWRRALGTVTIKAVVVHQLTRIRSIGDRDFLILFDGITGSEHDHLSCFIVSVTASGVWVTSMVESRRFDEYASFSARSLESDPECVNYV